MKRCASMLTAAAVMFSAAFAGSAAASDVFRVVASFYPVYLFALNVAGDVEGVSVASLTPPATGCLHDYQLQAEDMRAIADADALLVNGAGMESWLDKVKEQYPGLPVVDCSFGVSLLPSAHGNGEANPHIWLDPLNAAAMALNMGRGLAGLLPEKAAELQANAEEYASALKRLDAEIHAGLAGLKRREIVTFHEAFPYFAQAYGISVLAVVSVEPEEALSPRMLSDLVLKVREAGNPPLFAEPQYRDAALRAVALETGAQVYELDPLVTGDGDPRAYEKGMLRNMETLAAALGTD